MWETGEFSVAYYIFNYKIHGNKTDKVGRRVFLILF